MTADRREWLAAQPLPAAEHETVTVALQMIDALDRQMLPLDKELRAYARRQAGSKALMADYGIAELAAAAQQTRRGSPDGDYYEQAAQRIGGNRACLSVARKLVKRSYHTLRELGEEALQPA